MNDEHRNVTAAASTQTRTQGEKPPVRHDNSLSVALEVPARHFDATVGAITAREAVDDEETEDPALTDYLMRAWLELMSPSPTPVPRCPYCDGLRIRGERPQGRVGFQTIFATRANAASIV